MWTWKGNGPRTTRIFWRGKRISFLNIPRHKWRCVLKYHHWPNDVMILGMCGKCLPHPCCGSPEWDHAKGCKEAA